MCVCGQVCLLSTLKDSVKTVFEMAGMLEVCIPELVLNEMRQDETGGKIWEKSGK